MIGYIAFIRGINVGGKNIIKKEKLSEIFTSAGLRDVETFIQSGNVYFRSEEDASEIKIRTEKALFDFMGNNVPVMILPQELLKEVLSEDPFRDIPHDPEIKTYYVFLEGEPKNDISVPYKSEKDGITFFYRKGLIFCAVSVPVKGKYFYPNATLEKQTGTPATTRNIRTITALAEIG